jgi:beta-1,4-mannosyl-glycoprotein beta-1,4-N-acetylglucosaminyltransferase
MEQSLIVDAFIFNNELDLLEIRLNALKDQVSMFVLVEATQTFSGLPKRLFFEEHKERFANFNIKHVVLDDLGPGDAWAHERAHRNGILQGLTDFADDTLVLLSDIDEIPNLDNYSRAHGVFHHRLYYYFLNTFQGDSLWPGTIAMSLKEFRENSPEQYRTHRWGLPVVGQGWHFSTLGTAADIIGKVESFSHQEINTPEVKSKIAGNVENLRDPYGRNNRKLTIELPTGPKYLLDNLQKYDHMLLQRKPKISLVMIVKNEEEILDRCVESVQSVIEEVVIVDTGSTDATKEIIKKYGPLREYPFTNYVDSKNYALSLATGEYILFMDADEVLSENGHKLVEYAAQGVDGVSCKIVEGTVNEYDRMRLWKNNGQWQFKGPGVHECIVGPFDKITYDSSIKVQHLHDKKGKGNEYIAKFPKYVTLLKEAIAKDPGDARAWFYLGRTYKDMRDNLRAIAAYKKYLQLPSYYLDERWQAAYDIAVCFGDMGEYDKCFEWCDKAASIDDRRAESWNLKGLLYIRLQELAKALECYETALSKPKPENVTLFLNPLEYTIVPNEMALCGYDTLKRYRDSEHVLTKLIELSPGNEHYLNLLHERRILSRPKIFMILGHTPESVWGGILNERGVHGVETTYIELAKSLVQNGAEVFLFCNTQKQHKYDDVYYIPIEHLDVYVNYNPSAVITSREHAILDKFTCKKILWLQDASPFQNDLGVFSKADITVCSSPWHRHFIAQTCAGWVNAQKIKVLPLGMDKSLFADPPQSRDALQFIYASNPNRGLNHLLEWWSEIKQVLPLAKLDIYYGWESTASWGQSPEYKQRIEDEKNLVLRLVARSSDIRLRGRVTRNELIQAMQRAGVLTYPNDFVETYCLTAMEAQAAGMVVITTDLAALATTVNRESNILICNDPNEQDYKSEFMAGLQLITQPDVFHKFSMTNKEFALVKNPSWNDISIEWLRLIWSLL